MYGTNIGTIYPDEESYSNIPNFNGEKGFNHFLFSKDDVLINELGNFSSLGRGRFKNSNYTLVYDIGMGRAPSDNLTEIVSLDENYNNMFKYDKKKYMGIGK
jgi:hypothetical protein